MLRVNTATSEISLRQVYIYITVFREYKMPPHCDFQFFYSSDLENLISSLLYPSYIHP